MPDGIGEIGLARRCAAALAALKDVDGAATAEQRSILAGWSGWGPLAKAFDWNPVGPWEELTRQVGSLLDTAELQAARSAVDTAFYTPKPVISAVWQIVTGLGFDGGAVLEPGCGSGYFIAGAPALPIRWTGVEADKVSARIAAALHPEAQILAGRLEKTPLRRGQFDAVVGNVPFAKTGPYDPNAPDGLNLHNYFIWRSLEACRPGGIVALVTSRYTMDSRSAGQRAALAELGDFLGAIRLPSVALAAGGTSSVADIVVFRRRAGKPPAVPEGGIPDAWLRHGVNTDQITKSTISEYWLAHPAMVIGEMRDTTGGFQHGQNLEVVLPPGSDVAALIADAAEQLVEAARYDGYTWTPPVDLAPAADITAADAAGAGGADPVKDGAYTLHPDGSITQQRDGCHVPVKASAELATLIGLRDAAVALFAAEADQHMGSNERNRIRQEAFRQYQEYTAKHGYLNRSDLSSRPDPDWEDPDAPVVAAIAALAGKEPPPYTGPLIWTRRRPSMGGFRKDPDYVTVLALEIWDDDLQTGSPAAILLRHVNKPAERKEHTDDPAEALLLCLDTAARVDIDLIARILGVDPADVPGLLQGLIWEDPADLGTWLPTDEYLSGNVRAKLEYARAAAEIDPRWAGHVTALEAVQPADLTPEDISVQLGAPWIPAADVAAFITGILTGRGTGGGYDYGCEVHVNFAAITSQWEVHASTKMRQRPAATAQWGTLRVNACDLIEHALNGTSPVVYDRIDKDTKVRNEVETQLAADRIRDLQEQFAEWIWAEPKRADRLAALYNRRFNSVRLRRYDGSLLTFPGLDGGFPPLYDSQRDMTWRAVCTPASLCAFDVGAGKTAIMGLIAMTLRRLGLARKPAMVVPNHLLEQETAEIRRMFPGARILMVTKEDLTPERRKAFAAKCGARDWDLVVMTHQQMMALPVSAAVEAAYLSGIIAELDEAISDDSLENTRTAKSLARRRRKLTARHEELLDARRDDGLTFEQTGIDLLMVDEAHAYKNLEMAARAEGFSTAGSKRADDLMMKLGYLRSRNRDGRCGVLFTGTPISNALSELHVLLRYLAPSKLAELGLASFDGFAGQYIRYQQQTEVAPDGSGFRSYRRPVRYCNLPELRVMLGEVADIRTKRQLKLPGPDVVARHVVVPPQPELADFTAELVKRADDIRNGAVRPDEDNMLSVCTDGRRAALDLRLVGIDPTGEGKPHVVAENVAAIYHETKANLYPDPTGEQLFHPVPGALQLVFCDQGTPSAERGDQVYGWLRDELVALGVPRELIAFIHDAKSDGDKSALFARCRNGQVAVLLGSTEKCGTGVNIQLRMVAVHHVDAPWRPADVNQRDGRGDRPGNANQTLRIFRYVTERSFDSYMWQALERKAFFIAQILTGSLDAREVEDGGGAQVLTFAELKAIATGQPLLMEKAKVDAEIARLKQAKAGHSRMQARMYEDWRYAREHASEVRGHADQLRKIGELGAAMPRTLVRGGQRYAGEDVVAEIGGTLRYARDHKTRAEAGKYRGVYLSFEPLFYGKGSPQVTVRLETSSYASYAHTFRAAVKPWREGGVKALFDQIDQVIDDAAKLAAEADAVAASAADRAEEIRPFLHQEWPNKADLAAAVSYRFDLEREIDAQVKGADKAEPVASAA